MLRRYAAADVLGIGLDSESEGGYIALSVMKNILRRFCAAPYKNYQHSARHRVKCSGMTDARGRIQPPHGKNSVMTRHSAVLDKRQNAAGGITYVAILLCHI